MRVGDDLYIRSVNGPGSDWYRGTRANGRGSVHAGGVTKDVSFEDADGAVNYQVDAAYRHKYGRYGAYIIGAITGPQASCTTMRLVPRVEDAGN
ncbi:DUF2255 family protein [Kitasatospora atroaurantiaca]|uniref:DUF2255 family protein n=1 Tax=Kitasatospora atroaurantiaca TaxID=285545 RepID=UPI003CCC7AF0